MATRRLHRSRWPMRHCCIPGPPLSKSREGCSLRRGADTDSILHPRASTARRREQPASLGISPPLLLPSAESSLHPWASSVRHSEHPASPSIIRLAQRASCISRYQPPTSSRLHTGKEKRYKDERKRIQAPTLPGLRAARSKAQPGSELLVCTVCQSQERVWRVAAVGFPGSQSQPEMLSAYWQARPFPESHFPSCGSCSTSLPHPVPAGSQLRIHPGSIIS